jgi:hypothetical protein
MTQLKNKFKKTIFSTSKVKHNRKIKKTTHTLFPKDYTLSKLIRIFHHQPSSKLKNEQIKTCRERERQTQRERERRDVLPVTP